MNGNLIINDKPLLIIPTLAIMIGLNESIILQQLHYWLQRSKNIREDRKWVYFTYDQLVEQFPFFSKSTIRRAISYLENSDFITSNNFNKMKIDHTKWYTINYENVNELKNNEDNQQISEESQVENEMPLSNQEEGLICPNWADEVSNQNRAIPESTSKNTSKTSSSSKEACGNEDEKDPFRFFEQNGFGNIGEYDATKRKSCVYPAIAAMKLVSWNRFKRRNNLCSVQEIG